MLLKRGIIFLVILLITGAGFYAAYSIDESLTEEIEQANSKVKTTEAHVKELEHNLEEANTALAYWQDFSSSSHGDVNNFRRDYAKNLLAGLRDRNSILDLKLNMEPFAKSSEFEKHNAALFVSKVTIQFAAGTDIDTYNLMKDIAQSFPGNVEIKSFKIERIGNVDDSALLAIGEGRSAGIVKGEVLFDWQGIQPNPDPKPDKSANPGPPGMAPPGMAPGAAPNGVMRPTPPGGTPDV